MKYHTGMQRICALSYMVCRTNEIFRRSNVN